MPREHWPTTAVVLVGRGATDPDANAEVAKIARLLLEGRGIGTVETAFVSLARRRCRQGLERARLLGFARVVVLPYFLFAGVLPDRIVAQAAEWAARAPRRRRAHRRAHRPGRAAGRARASSAGPRSAAATCG